MQQNLADAISSFAITGVLENIIDNLDLTDNEIFQAGIVQDIKDALVSEAQTQVDNVKTNIVSAINQIDCQNRRRLRGGLQMEVSGTGDVERDLQGADTFSFLTNEIEALDFVSHAAAGYFAARDEVALDVGIQIEKVFNKATFESALSTVFDNLQGQSLFDANDISDIDDLLASLNATTSFTTDISFGLKVGDIGEIISSSAELPLEGLFLRVDSISVNAKMTGTGLDSSIFGSVSLDDGALDLMVGVGLVEPFELGLDLNGSLQNGISFAQTVTGKYGTIQLQPFICSFSQLSNVWLQDVSSLRPWDICLRHYLSIFSYRVRTGSLVLFWKMRISLVPRELQ